MAYSDIMGVELLLKAAEYIERREREAEHGYASSPISLSGQFKCDIGRTRKKDGGSRSMHNELEKNRRAHLRSCLDKLKGLVPLGPDATRHTTLGLLKKARNYIHSLEDKEKKNELIKDKLNREQRHLQRRLESLCADSETVERRGVANARSTYTSTITVDPSTSGAIGSSTADSSAEEANPAAGLNVRATVCTPISESDEVDVIGYTSTVSEDELSSVRSSSDSGVVVSASNSTFTIL